MATAKRADPVPLPPRDVVLTLTPREAMALYALTQLVGGDSSAEPRKSIDAIGRALYGTGTGASPYKEGERVYEGSLWANTSNFYAWIKKAGEQ